jgi:DNA ligase 1
VLDRLFKRNTNGSVQTWDIEVDDVRGRYRTTTAKLGGKAVVSEWTQCGAKNVGRSNATTPSEQAFLEAKALWEKKQRDGYVLEAGTALEAERFQCMLADQYVDHTHPNKSRKPRVLAAFESGQRVYVQPKLDGMRCIASKGKLLSRKHRPIVSVPHIAAALQPFFEANPDAVLDGEVYVHDLRDDFDQFISIARKTKPVPEDLERSKVLRYHVYDVYLPQQSDALYADRFAFLENNFRVTGYDKPTDVVVTLLATLATQEEHLDRLYEYYLGQGYEGQMVRLDAPYEQRRSDKLLKRKEFEDKEFTVLDVHEGEGNRTGQAGYVTVQEGPGGMKCKAGIRANEQLRIDLLRHKKKFVGGDVTVRFNGRTPAGVLRFPRAVAWHPGGRSD